MDLIETEGEALKNFTEIANASACTDQCQRHENCSVWTYKDGVCYMKNEKTFLIKTESNRLFSGMKDCVGKGKISLIYISIRIIFPKRDMYVDFFCTCPILN